MGQSRVAPNDDHDLFLRGGVVDLLLDPSDRFPPTTTRLCLPKDSEREEGEVSPPKTTVALPSPPQEKSEPPKQEEPVVELEIPPSPPPLEDIIAQRRARRQAILAKHAAASAAPTQPASPALSVGGLTLNGGASSGTGAPSTPLPNPIPAHVVQNGRSVTGTPEPGATKGTSAASDNGQATPSDKAGIFSLTKTKNEVATTEEGTSAAEYDPTLDWREDQARRAAHHTQAEIADGIGERGAIADDQMQVDEDDDDLDDMFAVGSRKIKLTAPKTAIPAPVVTAPALNMEADDPEGYYQIILGELLDNGKYQVFSILGKGMFSAVVRARVMDDPSGREVAIKMIRSQESMYKAGQKEIQILNKLAQADPDDKKHVIRLEGTFEHRGHLCLVFESLSMNLRDVIKKFGKDVGLNIRAVRAYAHQLFLALSLLKKANIMHADIKPDNILVSENKTVVKLCDLGSASDVSENDITPYLVSRFYRAPEIILGLPYDAAIDIWSIGCTLYELYTGKILFPGRTNNQMLLHMMELKGRFNTRMIRKAKFGDVHFDENAGIFLSAEKDRITGADVIKRVTITKPAKDVRARIMAAAGGKLSDEENKLTLAFVDLLDNGLDLFMQISCTIRCQHERGYINPDQCAMQDYHISRLIGPQWRYICSSAEHALYAPIGQRSFGPCLFWTYSLQLRHQHPEIVWESRADLGTTKQIQWFHVCSLMPGIVVPLGHSWNGTLGTDLGAVGSGSPRSLKASRSLRLEEFDIYLWLSRSLPHNYQFKQLVRLPVLHPPRLKRKTGSNKPSSAPASEPTCMPSVRNHKRSNTLELPEVENDDMVPQIRFKRKHMTPAVVPLSPRSPNIRLARGGKPGKPLGSVEKVLSCEDDVYMQPEYDSPNLVHIFASPRTAALELSFDEPPITFEPNDQVGYQEPYFPDSEEFYAEQLEELVVRAARSRAQHRERIARRWENLCNARLRFLREQAAHNRMLAQFSAAAASSTSPFNVFPVFTPIVPSSCDEPSPSPSESFGAPLSRMSSPYATYGETIDLAGMASVEHRQQILSDLGSYDSRPLVDRIIECMDEFEYDEICVDGLSEAECRQLRAESRKRRRLDRQRAFELGVLLELKHRQLGRSRSSSASSTSSDSSDSCSDLSSEPSTPPLTPLAVRSMDQLVAKMWMKRREAGHRPCQSAVATRAAFQARGCSSLRKSIEITVSQTRPRSRSESTKAAISDLFSLSGGVFGLGSSAWLKEKKRLTALDIE
ncbi:hypothetical protein OPQ81_006119 [Rhizoctonia solani]|nr:hypothetical protein OPQ81_006119 [Rhizoctonia solani]